MPSPSTINIRLPKTLAQAAVLPQAQEACPKDVPVADTTTSARAHQGPQPVKIDHLGALVKGASMLLAKGHLK